MAGRLTRFLNLERPHRGGDAPKHEVATTARFTGEPSGIALDRDLGEQPFLRCPRCEADNSRFAERCQNCQTILTGEDVRGWNEKLWAERKAQHAREQAAMTEAQREESLLRQNRALGEALAREVGERERWRLAWWGSGDGSHDATPIGVRLLSLLPTLASRLFACGVALAVFLGGVITALTARGHPKLQGASFVAAVLVVMLFTPGVPRRRRWWW